jgi:NAD(P)-dependent dehydrogenase (short-subunit alcohol dehydrogenase family)
LKENVQMEARRVIITAGASGIGRETARAFGLAGAAVFVCDIDEAGLSRLKEEIPGLQTAVCDVSDRHDVERMVAAGAAALGGVDVLVNNAGISGPTAPVEEMDPDGWERVLQVNLTGTFNVTRFAIPHLKNSKSGVILNMSSVAGRFGYANRSPYCVSKWGLIGFTKTLSIELGPYGIRVNAILPGAVAGERLEQVFARRAQAAGISVEKVREDSMSIQSLKTLVDPKDVAALCVFLASDSAKSISGQLIPIDNDTLKAS